MDEKVAERHSPLNQRIRADIELNILSGKWPPGFRIPFERELMDIYGCSRMTVHNALSRLVESGLIERRRRLGSFVAYPGTHATVLKLPDVKAEIVSSQKSYGYELLTLNRRVANKDDSRRLGEATRTTVIAITCRHLADGVPFAFEDRLINVASVPEASIVDFTTTPPSSWLLMHIPWTESEHRISCINADADQARILGLPEGTACLVIERRTKRNGQIMTHVRQIFDGRKHSLQGTYALSNI
ncbi:MAG: histidine utilization repressor [Mesorhizobium sp.]